MLELQGGSILLSPDKSGPDKDLYGRITDEESYFLC